MSLHNYIEKLRAKPVRERERIAIIGTAIGFVVILLIWVISFKEMNKPAEQPMDQTSASLNDLKDNFQDGKDSIQNMMRELPSQTGAAVDNSADANNPAVDKSDGSALPDPSNNLQNPSGAPDQNDSVQKIDNSPSDSLDDNGHQNNNQNIPSVPQLP